MQVRHLAIAALLVSATAAHAETRPHAGTLTGWATQTMVVGASTAAAVEAPVATTPIALEATTPTTPIALEATTPMALEATTPMALEVPLARVPVVAADQIVGPAAVEVPEPSSIALLLAGVMGVGALRRRRK